MIPSTQHLDAELTDLVAALAETAARDARRLERACRALGGLNVSRRAKRRAQIHRALKEVFPVLAECVLVIRAQTKTLRRASRPRR